VDGGELRSRQQKYRTGYSRSIGASQETLQASGQRSKKLRKWLAWTRRDATRFSAQIVLAIACFVLSLSFSLPLSSPGERSIRCL
jgi:hypothetical protein